MNTISQLKIHPKCTSTKTHEIKNDSFQLRPARASWWPESSKTWLSQPVAWQGAVSLLLCLSPSSVALVSFSFIPHSRSPFNMVFRPPFPSRGWEMFYSCQFLWVLHYLVASQVQHKNNTSKHCKSITSYIKQIDHRMNAVPISRKPILWPNPRYSVWCFWQKKKIVWEPYSITSSRQGLQKFPFILLLPQL